MVHDLHRVIAEATAMNAADRFFPVAQAQRYLEDYDEFLRTRVIFGSPESVIDRLEEFRERMGMTGLILDMNHGGQMVPTSRSSTPSGCSPRRWRRDSRSNSLARRAPPHPRGRTFRFAGIARPA